MGLLDTIAAPGQKIAYLFPEMSGGRSQVESNIAPGGLRASQGGVDDLFVFQFWPSQVTDNYTPNYATKQIPGASHPLYQWVSGSGRNISFTANFIAEVKEESSISTLSFNSRIAASTATSKIARVNAGIGAALLPSSRYTVNVAGALAALQQYLYPSYNNQTASKGITKPPRKLVLVLPGTSLGRKKGVDGILCILMGASVTMEAWFPSGELRAASVALQFAEIVQFTSGEGTNIRYIGAETYDQLAKSYISNVSSSPSDITF